MYKTAQIDRIGVSRGSCVSVPLRGLWKIPLCTSYLRVKKQLITRGGGGGGDEIRVCDGDNYLLWQGVPRGSVSVYRDAWTPNQDGFGPHCSSGEWTDTLHPTTTDMLSGTGMVGGQYLIINTRLGEGSIDSPRGGVVVWPQVSLTLGMVLDHKVQCSISLDSTGTSTMASIDWHHIM